MLLRCRRVLAGVVIAVVAAGIAWVVSAQGTTTIYGCVNNKNGALRVVGEDTSCSRGESRLWWNQQGPAGLPGADAPLTDFPRVAYAMLNFYTFDDTASVYEVGSLIIEPGGIQGDTMFVKIDAAIHADNNSSNNFVKFWLTHDETGQQSMIQSIDETSQHGSSVALTWVVPVHAASLQTFRLMFQPQQTGSGRWDVTAALSAISAPYGASGGKTLN